MSKGVPLTKAGFPFPPLHAESISCLQASLQTLIWAPHTHILFSATADSPG